MSSSPSSAKGTGSGGNSESAECAVVRELREPAHEVRGLEDETGSHPPAWSYLGSGGSGSTGSQGDAAARRYLRASESCQEFNAIRCSASDALSSRPESSQ